MAMTEDERQLLKNTAESLIRHLKQWDDTMEGMSAAIQELYRCDMTSREKKLATLARLRIKLELMGRQGKGAKYLAGLIADLEKWTGFNPPAQE